jgi:sensor c-di-GMP phosphodiesterase-like protein
MKNLILAGVIGSIVFMGLACGQQNKSAEPSQLQQAIERRNAELEKYQ